MIVEFENELQGCKKPMSRELTGLMPHKKSGVAGHSVTADVDENSDVAGNSAAAVVDERRVASSTIELTRCEAVESQKVGSSSRCSIVLCMYRWKEQRSSNSHCNNAGRVAGRYLPQHHWRGQHAHNCFE